MQCMTLGMALLATVWAASAQEGAAEAPRGEREEISFWFYSAGTLGLQFQEIAHRFNEVQDRYYVKTTMMPWNSNQKVLSSLAAGIPPDVLMVDRPAAPGWIGPRRRDGSCGGRWRISRRTWSARGGRRRCFSRRRGATGSMRGGRM